MPVYQQGNTAEDIRAAVALALSPERRRYVVTQRAREAQVAAEAAYQQEFGKRRFRLDITVDGRAAAGLANLDPDQGEVAFRFERGAEVLAWIYGQLVMHSPVLTGDYAASHVMLADDVRADPANPPQAERYLFFSTAPYAKKIEGDFSRAPQSRQAPDGVYQAVAVLADHQFGETARIGFGYESPMLDYIAGEHGAGARKRLQSQPTRMAGMRLERATRVPVITVVLV